MAAGTLKIDKIISQFEIISERFGRLFRRFLRVLTFSPFDEGLSRKKVLVLSIEKGSVSIAYGSRLFRKIRVKEIRAFNYDEGRFPSPEELASAAKVILSQFKTMPDVDLIIPKSWTVLKIAEFPTTVKENLQNVLTFEMDRLTPFNPEDVFYDYRLLREEGNRLFLLLAVTKKDYVNPYIEALRERGIHVKKITTSLSAMAALSFHSGLRGSTIFLDIGRESYEAGLFEGSVAVDHLMGNFDGEDYKTKADRVIKELQPFFEKTRASGSTPEIILLPRDNNVKEMLKTRINYPLRILGETDLKIKLPLTSNIPYVALGGLVESLGKAGEGLDLLSYGIRKEKKIPIFLTVVLIISIFCLTVVYFIIPLRVEERRLHAIEEEIAQKKAEAKKIELLKKEVEDLRNDVTSIKKFKEGRSSLAILKEMTVTLPKNAWLTRFRITEVGVDIEGYAGSATELLPKLEASRYFRKVEFSSPTFRDARMNADRFIIKMEIDKSENPR